jgi:indolepyruvate ferredoxin oxidoreductase beta subunit
MRGFNYGLAVARGEVVELQPRAQASATEPVAIRQPASLNALRDRIVRDYPASTREIVLEGAARTADYQDLNYASLYLDRLDKILVADRAAKGDYSTTRETARYLALWMTYEDVIRVAQIKTRASRLDRARTGAGAKADQTVILTEFLKPGLDEFCSILPAFAARPLLAWADRTGRRDKLNVGLHLRTSTIFGFALLRAMAGMKFWRRRGHRFGVEQQIIARWLAAIAAALPHDTTFAREIAENARLVKGYSDTHRRGQGNFLRLMDNVVDPALAAAGGADHYANAAAALATARKAALADPEGDALNVTLEKLGRTAAHG